MDHLSEPLENLNVDGHMEIEPGAQIVFLNDEATIQVDGSMKADGTES